jgi:ATP-dependent Zn protease
MTMPLVIARVSQFWVAGQDACQHLVFHIGYDLLFLSAAVAFFLKIEKISYSQFKQYVDQGIANELIIGPESIKGMLAGSPKRAFATVRVNDPNLVKELDEGQIGYSGRHENRFLTSLLSWVLPLGIFFLIWRFAMKEMGTGTNPEPAFGRNGWL